MLINIQQSLTVVALLSVVAQPRRNHNSPSSPEAYDDSPLTPSLLPSPVPLGPAPAQTQTHRKLFLVGYMYDTTVHFLYDTQVLKYYIIPVFHLKVIVHC